MSVLGVDAPGNGQSAKYGTQSEAIIEDHFFRFIFRLCIFHSHAQRPCFPDSVKTGEERERHIAAYVHPCLIKQTRVKIDYCP